MSESARALVWCAIALPTLLVLQRWIHRHLQGLAFLLTGHKSWAVAIYAIVLFPGVVLHELSHWLTARLLGVRTGSISLLPRIQKDGYVQLGYVEYYRGGLDPIRESLIGGAPLVAGTVGVLLIGFLVFDVSNVAPVVQRPELATFLETIERILAAPDAFLWLYLLFAISNAMMPSASDRRAWPALILLLAVFSALLIVLRLEVTVFLRLKGPVTTALSHLALAFSLAIGVDVAVIIVIFLVEWLTGRARGVRVRYE